MRATKQRRGVTLLFVVSMIVMFMLLGTTFLVISSQYLRSAKSYTRSEVFRRDPANELDQAFWILLRDTTDPDCPIRGHSLLADLYGWLHGFSASIESATYDNNEPGQYFVQLEIENWQSFSGLPNPIGEAQSLLAGRVITITSGQAKGMVGRILANDSYDINAPLPTLTFSVLFERDHAYGNNNLVTNDFLNSLQGASLIVNGPAFQGKGAGFDPNAAADAAAYTAVATTPNRAGDTDVQFRNGYVRTNAITDQGDVNETWDAADYQNMWLSAQFPMIQNDASGTPRFYSEDLPAFFRPGLANNGGFRPDDPDFPAMQNNGRAIGGDVDNDGDLLPDSVWVDFNLPIMTDRNGRTYKRMFAVLVRDMDGKLNLNAHSNAYHEDVDLANGNFAYNTNLNGDTIAYQDNATMFENSTLFSADGLVGSFARGQGWGPPEINLRTVIRNNEDFKSLQYGADIDNDSVIDVFGRNGYDSGSGIARPGFDAPIDDVVDFEFRDIPTNTFFENTYGSFWDIHGRCVMGHDFNGQPRFSATTQLATERLQTEYERRLDLSMQYVNTSSFGAKDMPFSYGELERVLRGFDNDSSILPSRITDLMPNTFNLTNTIANRAATFFARSQVTTHSFDIPVPPSNLRKFYAEKLMAAGISAANANQVVEDTLPQGILFGSKMNLNFPLGNGRDNNGNGVVDEGFDWRLSDYISSELANSNDTPLNLVDESYAGEYYPPAVSNPAPYTNVGFDHDADGQIDDDDFNSTPDTRRQAGNLRQDRARRLYRMARLIVQRGIDENGLVIDATTVPEMDGVDNPAYPSNPDEADLAQWLAQWAINVVDFYDSDSIMTPFEYDINPFDDMPGSLATLVDGNPKTDDGPQRGLVFGCERPELLITETFIYHDRRSEDLDNDDSEEETTTAAMDEDDDFDQRLLPFGGMMLELWNPNSNQTRTPNDLYNNANGTYGVDLTRLSSTPEMVVDGGGTSHEQRSPVWRMVVTTLDFDLDKADLTNAERDSIQRAIYFSPLSRFGNDIERLRYDLPFTPTSNNTFAPTANVANAIHPIGVQRTAVIGTGHLLSSNNNTLYFTPMGRRSDVDESVDLNLLQTRGFIMDTANRELTVREFDGTNVSNFTRSTEVIPIENLNVSEPDGGYSAAVTAAGFTLGAANIVDATYGNFTEPVITNATGQIMDNPLDQLTYPVNGTLPRNDFVRFIHLQRLANPMVGWDAEVNPYRTVDSMPLDLHVFNGAGGSDPGLGGAAAANQFGTRERGEVGPQQRRRELWSNQIDRENDLTQTASPAGADLHFHSFFLEDPNTNDHEETLGESLVNTGYSTIINFSYDYVNNNAVFPLDIATGDPTPVEFPSLTWNNRPYVSQYELMLVPRTSSSQLLRVFSTGDDTEFGGTDYVNDVDADDRFNHLFNFFRASEGGQPSVDLHQLFDYIYVPTKFSDFKDFKDLELFANNSFSFKPPYNFLPTFREPGRVNLNTVSTHEILDGVKGGAVFQGGHHGDATWENFVSSRRGAAAGNVYDVANPFRSGEGGNLTDNNARSGVEVSLMRSDDFAGTGTAGAALLDSTEAFNTQTTNNELHNPNRHAYLRYKNRVRLGNLATTRSNVFSVWITVGYFEFNPTTGQLGAELGSESGQIERHRAFYMIDRSIPVGFEPGKNHNVDKTIMLRRYIE